ncbi:transposase [Serratia fonticola]
MLRQRRSLTVWLDESAIAAWTENAHLEGRGRPLHYTDMAITTLLMMKSVFNLPLCCPDYSLASKRANSVNISIKMPTRGEISHLVIDATGLKVFGEGEWKVDQHGVWCKFHLVADSATHEIICADLPLSGTTDAQALPRLINQTHRKIREASIDGVYDTRYCHERYHAVANQPLRGSNDVWKKKVGYHRRSVAETAMFLIKILLGGHLSLRDYDVQVG